MITLTILPGSPADEAGLKTGDRLLRCNGVTINSHEDYIAALDTSPAKVVSVMRGDRQLTFTIAGGRKWSMLEVARHMEAMSHKETAS